MRLTMICPSRGRPQAAEKVRESFLRTTKDQTRLVFALDRDDPSQDDYPPIRFTSDSNSTVSAMNNAAAKFAQDSEYLGFLGDDCRFITEGWDTALMEAANGGFAYPNDLMDPGALPSIFVVSSRIVKELGYMVPPPLVAICFDDWALAVGKAIDRITYCDDVVIQHISLPNPKARPNNDFETWRLWRIHRLADDVKKARAALPVAV